MLRREAIRSLRSLTRVGIFVVLVGCKTIATQSEGGAPTETELTTRSPSPTSPPSDFHVDDEVSILKEDGTFEVTASIDAACGKLLYVVPTPANNARVATTGWVPADEPRSAGLTVQRTAEHGYKVRTGLGRGIDRHWLPASQVFPAPWPAFGKIKVGDVLYQRRFGNFESPKCVVKGLPTTRYDNVSVQCGNAAWPTGIERKDLFPAFTHRSASDLHEGEIVYLDKMHWAMVVGKSGPDVILRESGFGAPDKVVDVSRIESVR